MSKEQISCSLLEVRSCLACPKIIMRSEGTANDLCWGREKSCIASSKFLVRRGELLRSTRRYFYDFLTVPKWLWFPPFIYTEVVDSLQYQCGFDIVLSSTRRLWIPNSTKVSLISSFHLHGGYGFLTVPMWLWFPPGPWENKKIVLTACIAVFLDHTLPYFWLAFKLCAVIALPFYWSSRPA